MLGSFLEGLRRYMEMATDSFLFWILNFWVYRTRVRYIRLMVEEYQNCIYLLLNIKYVGEMSFINQEWIFMMAVKGYIIKRWLFEKCLYII